MKKNNSMAAKAIRAVLLYYISGFFITLVVHLLLGWESKALMPRSIVVIVVFIVAALSWFFINLTNLLVPCKREKNLRELFVHSVFLTSMFAIMIALDKFH